MTKILNKGETLTFLKKKKLDTYTIIPDLLIFKKKYFLNNNKLIINKIRRKFKKKIIIRSSAIDEDVENNSNAGKYFSCISNLKPDDLLKNINKVCSFLKIDDYFIVQIFISKPNYLKNIYIQTDKKYNLLIAPTWNTNFYENHFLYNLIEILNEHKINYCFRPHPMSIKKNEFDLKILKEKKINFDNSTNLNLFPFDNLITDWSGIMFEFFYLKQKKPILIDTNEKKINKLNIINNYESIENLLRKEIGIIHNKNDLLSIIQTLKNPVNHKNDINKYEIFF